MGVDITAELCVFFSSVASGLLSGVIYDFFGIFRQNKTKRLLVTVSDVVLSLIICAIIVSVFYMYNSFELRYHMFIGLFSGMIFYFLCLSKIFVFLFMKIFQIFEFILKILLTPAHFLYKILLVYLFRPVSAFMVVLFKKIVWKMNKLKIDRGIEKNERKSKKKHKKKIKYNSCGSRCSSSIYVDKRDNASAADY